MKYNIFKTNEQNLIVKNLVNSRIAKLFNLCIILYILYNNKKKIFILSIIQILYKSYKLYRNLTDEENEQELCHLQIKKDIIYTIFFCVFIIKIA